jgi:hypothetical protein
VATATKIQIAKAILYDKPAITITWLAISRRKRLLDWRYNPQKQTTSTMRMADRINGMGKHLYS